MGRVLQIFSILASILTGVVLVLCVLDLERVNPEVERICRQQSVLQRFEELKNPRDTISEENSPLVIQAKAFAAYLNGPVEQEKKEVLIAEQKSIRDVEKIPKIQFVPTAKFKLEGTSYYPQQPERSIALIRTPNSNEDNPRWVKEGERLGHFVIHKIRRGVVVYQDENEQLHEMSIERKTVTRNLVREHISSLTAAQADFGQLSASKGQPDSNSLPE